jgi:TPR repeat protein
MPLERNKSMFRSCCGKLVCNGCAVADVMSNGGDRCPFCREPDADDQDENKKRRMERIKANDPAAMGHMGLELRNEGEYDKAFEYYTRAAELGDSDAHYMLGLMYVDGDVVEKDKEKEVYHNEKAAIGGHPWARHNLGCYEHENGNMERAVKHWIIAANLGYEDSMKHLWRCYSAGAITKEDLDATLRTHQAAINEMKSKERDLAEKIEEIEIRN